MTTQEAAELLGVDPATVRQAILAGRLEATKRGRDWWLTPAAVERYRTGRRPKPARPQDTCRCGADRMAEVHSGWTIETNKFPPGHHGFYAQDVER